MDKKDLIIKAYKSGYDVSLIARAAQTDEETVKRTIFDLKADDFAEAIRKCRMLDMSREDTEDVFHGSSADFIKAEKIADSKPPDKLKRYDIVKALNDCRRYSVIQITGKDVQLKENTKPFKKVTVSKKDFFYGYERVLNTELKYCRADNFQEDAEQTV